MVPRFELRVLALAPGASTNQPPATAASQSTPPAPGDGGDGSDDGKAAGAGGEEGARGAAAGGGEDGLGAGAGGIPGEGAAEALLLSAAVVESHPMDPGENAVCMTLVRLEQGGSPRMYVAVGTGMDEPQGEDKAVRNWGGGAAV